MSETACPLEKAASIFGAHPAIISGKKVISYEQYYQMAVCVSLGLLEKRMKHRQRVGIIADNCWEYVILLQALFKLGAVACLVSPRFPEKSILSILDRIDCHAVIDPLDRLSAAGLRHVQKIALNDVFSCKPRNNQGCGDGPPVNTDLNAYATIILTSGTSGVPKAALHTYGNHYYSALGSNRNIVVQPGDRWLLSLPLFHVGGLGIVFRMLLGGGTVVISESKEEIGATVERYSITHLSLVSTQLYRWLNQGVPKKTKNTLKAVLVGGGPVPAALVNRAHNVGLPLHTTYGLTEMASQVTTSTPRDTRDRLLTAGKLLEYRDLMIDDGEILVKGRTLFKGYVEGGKTTLLVDDRGWFRTGDLGGLDDDGYLTFVGRKDNMFISGGENIDPEEIEGLLCLLPSIVDAVVVPVEDEEFGFRPVAFVKTSEGKGIDRQEFVTSLEDYLPRFKIPVMFHKWPEGADQGGIKSDRRYLAGLAAQLKRENIR